MPRNKEFDYHEKLESVRNLFWEKGYHATSIHDIVAVMKLNRSSIYNTYGNKHTLFLECLKDYTQMKTAQYKKASKYSKNAFEALSHTVHDVMNQTIKDKKACLIVRSIFELGDTDAEVRAFIAVNAAVLEEIFRELIDQAKEDGDIKDTIPSDLASKYILSGFSGFYKYYMLSGNKKEVEEMIDFMLMGMKA